jgi:energy-coupling factor transport system permease protein
MEARAYNPRYARTRYRNYAVNWFDWVLFLFLSYILGILLLFSGEHIFFAPFGWPDAILMYGA